MADRPRIQQLRHERGWTQQDLATEIGRIAWVRDEELVGANPDMIAKWERGAKGISRRYRELLCLAFDVDEKVLGLVQRPTAGTMRASTTRSDQRQLGSLGDAAALFDELGPAGALLQSKMFEVWKDEAVRRRDLLKAMSLAPAAGASYAADQTSQGTVSRFGPGAVAQLDELAARYQTLYHSADPAALLTPVTAHLGTVDEAIVEFGNSAARRKLLANRARVATLAGRLAFFDLQDSMSARGHYSVALEAARECGDHHQAAAVLGHMAFIPAAEHGAGAALDYLNGAKEHLSQVPSGPLTSWVAAVESEVHANNGSYREALAATDAAREALHAPGLNVELPWFDYYDETRLEGFAGYAALQAQRYDQARDALNTALHQLPRGSVKQRTVFLTDLATTSLREGDLDAACDTAGDAAEELQRAGYATGFGRLREFRAEVEPWSSSRAVSALDDRLRAVA